MHFIQLNKELRCLKTEFHNSQDKVNEIKSKILQALIVLSNETVFNELVALIVTSTKENLSQSIDNIIEQIYNTFINNQIIDLENIHEQISKKTPPTQVYKGQDYPYEVRKEFYFAYLKTYIKPLHLQSINAVDYLCRIPNYFCLPLHRKRFKKRKNFIRIDFYCNHSGNSKGNTKSENCQYQMTIKYYYNGQIDITEKMHDTEKGMDHSHSVTMKYIMSKNTMLTTEHRKEVKELISKEKSFEEFMVKNENIVDIADIEW